MFQVGRALLAAAVSEAGGHPGMDEVGNIVIVPQTVDAVKIPVLFYSKNN